ncbi:MAG: hypothetical protein ACLR43_01985 [Faecalibacillus faecis]
MVTGLQAVGNNFYYFNASGKMKPVARSITMVLF